MHHSPRDEYVSNFVIRKHGDKYFAVYDPAGALVCVTLYRCGAREVVRRLAIVEPAPVSATPQESLSV